MNLGTLKAIPSIVLLEEYHPPTQAGPSGGGGRVQGVTGGWSSSEANAALLPTCPSPVQKSSSIQPTHLPLCSELSRMEHGLAGSRCQGQQASAEPGRSLGWIHHWSPHPPIQERLLNVSEEVCNAGVGTL